MEILESNYKREAINKIIESFKGERKIKVRRLINSIKNQKHFIILEQRKRETQNWEFVAAEATVISKNYEEKTILIKIHISM